MSTEQPEEEEEDILTTAEENPEEIDVESVVELLEHEQGQTRNVALMTLRRLADHDVDRVVDHTDAIIGRLTDDFPVAQEKAASALVPIAPEYPEAVQPALPRLIEMLDQDPPITAYRAGRAMAPLLEHDPEAFVEHTDELLVIFEDLPNAGIPTQEELEAMDEERREELIDILESRSYQAELDIKRSYGVREITVHALVEITEREPEVVGDRVTELRPIFDAEPPIARAAAMDVVANVAQHDPTAVEPVIDDVIEIATSDTTQIRSHAIQALGYAGATEAIDPLYDIANANTAEEPAVTAQLAELARETAEFLEAED